LPLHGFARGLGAYGRENGSHSGLRRLFSSSQNRGVVAANVSRNSTRLIHWPAAPANFMNILRSLLFGFAALAFTSSELQAQASSNQGETVARQLKGCWSVHIGRWSSQEDRPWVATSEFLQPPARVELSDVPYNGGWKVNRLPGTSQTHRFALYTSIGQDSLRFVWSTGFSGLTAVVVIRGDSLVGQAKSFWDYTRSFETAPIVLVRAICL
jgi:hypothetical protein